MQNCVSLHDALSTHPDDPLDVDVVALDEAAEVDETAEVAATSEVAVTPAETEAAAPPAPPVPRRQRERLPAARDHDRHRGERTNQGGESRS